MTATGRSHGFYHEIKSILVEHDPAFAGLESEKRLGWESKDVERLWQLRTEKLNFLNEKKASKQDKHTPQVTQNPFTALAEDVSEDEEDVVGAAHAEGGAKSMIRAGKGPSYDKYYSFYKELFTNATKHADVFCEGHKRFVDIGCAPGGLCAYFVRDLGWSGIGFSLQLERGGLKVRFKDPNLKVFHCDMSELESVDLINQEVGGGDKYDFINCGVVMGKHQVESIGEDRETALQILRVNRNQFLAALTWLANGGDLFWVFQTSNIGCWLYFLGRLQKCFKKPISLFSTLVPSRSPVYALCSGFEANCAATQEWIAELSATREFDDTHLANWNVTSWAEAGPLIASLNPDIHNIWNAQRMGLKEIREAASSQLEKEETLLKKLSGSRFGSKEPESGGATSSFTKRTGHHKNDRADFDGDWRKDEGVKRPTSSDPDGWSKVVTTSGTHKNSGGFRQSRPNSRSSEMDTGSWRK